MNILINILIIEMVITWCIAIGIVVVELSNDGLKVVKSTEWYMTIFAPIALPIMLFIELKKEFKDVSR